MDHLIITDSLIVIDGWLWQLVKRISLIILDCCLWELEKKGNSLRNFQILPYFFPCLLFLFCNELRWAFDSCWISGTSLALNCSAFCSKKVTLLWHSMYTVEIFMKLVLIKSSSTREMNVIKRTVFLAPLIIPLNEHFIKM